jgi:hypothetical protein
MATTKGKQKKKPAPKKTTKKQATKKTPAKKTTKKTAPKKKVPAKKPARPATTAAGPAQIEVDVNSVRHWIAYVEVGNPNWADLDNKLIKQLGSKEIEPYFRPLRFAGWRRMGPDHQPVVSPLKKHVSNTFIFETEDPSVPPAPFILWGLEQLKRYLEPKREYQRTCEKLRGLRDQRQAAAQPVDADLAHAREVLARYDAAALDLDIVNDKRFKLIPPEIARFESLESLTVTLTAIRTVPPELGELRRLRYLSLESNQLETLSDAVAALDQLEDLNLEWNERISELPPALGKLTNLRCLYLGNCCNLMRLPDEIGQLTRLEHLAMEATALRALPDSIGRLTNLRYLSLTFSTDVDDFRVPEAFTELTALEECWLDVPAPLPERIDRLTALRDLHLGVELYEREAPRLRQILPRCQISVR